MSVKAQALSFDFIIAASIFLLVVGIIYIYWIYTNTQIEETKNINDMIDKTYSASYIWFREGYPSFWNSTDVIDLGMENDHRFNQTKMNFLNKSIDPTNIGYNKTKTFISLGGYDYFFRIYNSTDDTLFNFGLYHSNPRNVVKVERIGILNGSIVTLEVLVWQ